MGAREKRIEGMRKNPTNCSMADMDWLLAGQAGCQKRGGNRASHFIYKHPSKWVDAFPDGVNVPFDRPIKSHYVKRALDYYDALTREEGEG